MKHTSRWLICITILMLWLTACEQGAGGHQHHQQGSNTNQSPQVSQQLALKLLQDRSLPSPGKAMTLRSSVQAGNQPVTDAKVEFEVWKKGNTKHDMLEARMAEKGIYTASYTPKEDGEYLMILHVTTPQVHQMIDGKFTVGNPQTEAHSQQNGHHHGVGLTMHVMLPNTAKTGDSIPLTAHVSKEGNPFVEADVQFEYWKDGESKHQYIKAKEQKPGEYTTSVSLPTTGTYHVKLHVEKGNVHDHTEKTLVVK